MNNSQEVIIPIYRGLYLYLPDYNLIIPKEMKDQFFLSSPLIKKVTIQKPTLNMIENIKWKMHNIINFTFEVTQNCNLRCKYCIYGGSYLNQRSHSNKEINFKVAENAIDYISNLVEKNNKKKINVGFYGGEPLLNLKAIKRIIPYARNAFADKIVTFSMTTNGTLLSDKTIDFLIKNNIRISVSLDGPKEIHDSNRIFKNGNGSYDLVINNLKKIKKVNKDYYENYVGIISVWAKDQSIKKIYEFFLNHELFNNQSIRSSRVRKHYNSHELADKKIIEEYKYVISKIEKKLQRGEKLKSFENAFFLAGLKDFENRLKKRRKTSLFESCLIPSKMYIDVDGNFHICNLINQKFPIGNVEKGVNLSDIKKILTNNINLQIKHCTICDIRYLCLRCHVHFADDGNFEIRNDFCKVQKKGILESLNTYVRLKNEGIF